MLNWIEAGVAGCVGPEDSVEDLAVAVALVARGELVTPPDITTRLIGRIRRLVAQSSQAAEDGRLTPRQGQVLALVDQGPFKQGDRPAALHPRADGQESHAPDPAQVRCPSPRRGGCTHEAPARAIAGSVIGVSSSKATRDVHKYWVRVLSTASPGTQYSAWTEVRSKSTIAFPVPVRDDRRRSLLRHPIGGRCAMWTPSTRSKWRRRLSPRLPALRQPRVHA